MNIVGVIPAHLASVRFPRKILFDFFGLPMIEHVRRRALLSKSLSRVIVATCDAEVADVIRAFGGEVVITASTHRNGTTRVAEAIQQIDCSHVVLLQGDEPLLLPGHVDSIADAIRENPAGDAWNATGPINDESDLDKHSFVKCAVTRASRILYCFRRTPGYARFEIQQQYIRKILGLIAYRREVLNAILELKSSYIEEVEFIEQLRLLEHGYSLQSVPVTPSLPSVNEPIEADIVIEYTKKNIEQMRLFERTGVTI